jgi:hypothetical protein
MLIAQFTKICPSDSFRGVGSHVIPEVPLVERRVLLQKFENSLLVLGCCLFFVWDRGNCTLSGLLEIKLKVALLAAVIFLVCDRSGLYFPSRIRRPVFLITLIWGH